MEYPGVGNGKITKVYESKNMCKAEIERRGRRVKEDKETKKSKVSLQKKTDSKRRIKNRKQKIENKKQQIKFTFLCPLSVSKIVKNCSDVIVDDQNFIFSNPFFKFLLSFLAV